MQTPPLPHPPTAAPEPPAGGTSSFGSLLRRYLLPVGLVERPAGDIYACRSVVEHNKDALRRWLPHYVRVHAALAGLLLTAAGSAGAADAPVWVVAAVAVPAAGEMGLAICFLSAAIALRLE